MPLAVEYQRLLISIADFLQDCRFSRVGSAENENAKAFKPLSKFLVMPNGLSNPVHGCRHIEVRYEVQESTD